jgi:hypothetical protein
MNHIIELKNICFFSNLETKYWGMAMRGEVVKKTNGEKVNYNLKQQQQQQKKHDFFYIFFKFISL